MKPYRSLALFFVLLALPALGCRLAASVFATPTPIPSNTPIPPTATYTLTFTPTTTPTITPTPTLPTEFTENDVRLCYYIPGVSVPAQMPPEVLATPTPVVYPTPMLPFATQVDANVTEQQLGIFNALWKAVRDNYVYTDFNGKDWDAIGNKYEMLIKKGLSSEDFYFAMREMIYELEDEHSSFLSPEMVNEDEAAYAGENDFVGIGAISSSFGEPDSSVIISIFPNSPAEMAGLRPHDKIIAVDGEPFFDENGQSRTLGPADTPVTLTVVRPGEQARDITIIRKPISGSVPIDYCMVPNTRIGYIFLPTFYDETIDNQVYMALKQMTADGPLDGLVLDNRMNTGGADTIVKPILGYFTSGVQGYFVNRTEREPFRISALDVNGSQKVPLVVLVDTGTVSFGEIFSGVLRLSGRATIVGQTTLGNVEVLHAFPFDDGSLAWIATSTFEPLDGDTGVWERTGIVPDYLVPTRWDLFTESTDPAFAKAVEILLAR